MALGQFPCCVFKSIVQRGFQKKLQHEAPILDLKSRIKHLCEALLRLILSLSATNRLDPN